MSYAIASVVRCLLEAGNQTLMVTHFSEDVSPIPDQCSLPVQNRAQSQVHMPLCIHDETLAPTYTRVVKQ